MIKERIEINRYIDVGRIFFSIDPSDQPGKAALTLSAETSENEVDHITVNLTMDQAGEIYSQLIAVILRNRT